MNKIYDEILESIPSFEKRANKISNDISAQILEYMKEKGINQRQLAERLGKRESEISKWLNGNHNFTIETIAKIEDVFDNDIVLVPMFAKEDLNIKFESSFYKNAFIDLTTEVIKNHGNVPKYVTCLVINKDFKKDIKPRGNIIELTDSNVTYPIIKTGTDN